jgi:hypothetical protein
MLIAGLVAGGCQQTPPTDTTVCDYQPGKPVTQIKIDDQGVFALVHRDKLTNEGLATEVGQFQVDGGSNLGFQMDHQQLIAVAGPTTLPLEAGSYSWQALTETAGARELRERHEHVSQNLAFTCFALVTWPFVVVLAAFAGWWKGTAERQ